MNRSILHALVGLGFCASLLACGDDDPPPPAPPPPCSPSAQTGCGQGLVCEEVTGAEPACFAPVMIRGRVLDAMTEEPIENARLVARDANDVTVSNVAVSAADGTYSLRVPAKRSASGEPVSTSYTLRADAAGYLTFPKAPRVALPIDVALATVDSAAPDEHKPLVVSSSATDVALIPLEDASSLSAISGVVHADQPGGTLVVANGATGVADASGAYVVFNVPVGTINVSGYAAGVQLDTATAQVTAGAETTGVDLHAVGPATATVSGQVSIVNAPGGLTTSVVLAVEETFVEAVGRGEVPRGLRVGNVSGAWQIEGVPNGRYVVLAAFENDGLVRDPDTSIGGTELVHIVVDGADQPLSQSFKVTGALAVIEPDGAEEVSGTPTFTWEDDSSEDAYVVELFDAFGTLTWSTEGNFDPGGNAPASVQYGGPALEPGMFYQFRATSMKDGVPISRTEDLKGVFVYR